MLSSGLHGENLHGVLTIIPGQLSFTVKSPKVKNKDYQITRYIFMVIRICIDGKETARTSSGGKPEDRL